MRHEPREYGVWVAGAGWYMATVTQPMPFTRAEAEKMRDLINKYGRLRPAHVCRLDEGPP